MSKATALLCVLCALSGCSTRDWVESADREVEKILEESAREVPEEQDLLQPAPRAEDDAEQALGTEREDPKDALQIDLAKALATAVAMNRGYLSQKESLYLTGLSLSFTRFQFGPLLSSTVSYLASDSETGSRNQGASTNFSLSQILPTGGTLSFTSSLNADFPQLGDTSYSTSAGINLSQPLLRGGGYLVSHEALTQAERSMIYAVRDFELFRQDFAISTAQSYFNLVRQKVNLDNEQRRYNEAVFDRKKAKALRQVDRSNDRAVFLAQRRETDAQESLLNARANYDQAVDSFKIDLGLETTTPVVIVNEEPPFEIVNVDPDSAIEVAKYNRLDIATQRDQLEDTRRGLRIAKLNLLPQLNLDAGYSVGDGGTTLGQAFPDDWSWSAGLSFTVPLQRRGDRNAYRSAQIAVARGERSLTLTYDNLALNIRNQLRQLRSLEAQIILSDQDIAQEERAVAVTEIRFESGDVDNRDLLDARQALIDARNAIIQRKVDHFIRRLQLLRALGLLFIDDKGMWR